MAEIGQLPPAYRVPPARPASGSGQGNQAPQRKPKNEDRQPDQRRQPRKDDDAESSIDEYV
jgi:hypothetical protein